MAPEPLFKREWVAKGSLVIPYGTMSTLPLGFTSGIDKFVMDDIGQMHAGHLGALRPHIDAGLITEQSFYAEIGEIAAGNKPGRTGSDETILFWHRGLATSDIALGAAMLGKAASQQEREMDGLIGALLSILEPGMIIVMGILVLSMVVALLLPIFEMNKLVL